MDIIFIKIGGSLITDKDKPFVAKEEAIAAIMAEIKRYTMTHPEMHILLGNGAGSFGHYPAIHYQVKDGMTVKTRIGFSQVQQGVLTLNQIVCKAAITQDIPVVAVSPSSIITTNDKETDSIFTKSIVAHLKNNMVPVVYGDILADDKNGCCIYSTERIFTALVNELHQKNNMVVRKIIHATVVDGVLDTAQKVIPHITKDNFSEVKQHLFATAGFDVTGGMLHKIESSLNYAQKGISSSIVNGAVPGRLFAALNGEETVATTIS